MRVAWSDTSRKVKALTLALLTLHLRTGRAYAGATYAALRTMLGTTNRPPLNRQIADAVACGFVSVRYSKQGLGVVLLTKHALRETDRLFSAAIRETEDHV